MLFVNSSVFLMYLLIASVFAVCLSAMVFRPPLPLRRTIVFIGSHSYPQYLFHLVYFGILARSGIIDYKSPLRSVLATLALYPVFLAVSATLEYADRRLADLIMRRMAEAG
jgi:peptidoglycan/LPS O-acetylase OafA/YrhL